PLQGHTKNCQTETDDHRPPGATNGVSTPEKHRREQETQCYSGEKIGHQIGIKQDEGEQREQQISAWTMTRHDLRQVLIAFELGLIPVHAAAPRLSIPSTTL